MGLVLAEVAEECARLRSWIWGQCPPLVVTHLISFFLTYVFILLGVAYFTLLERKGLAYFQRRKGPNKVGVGGLLQPLADALKLFLKEFVVPTQCNKYCFVLAPVFALTISLML